MTDDGQMIDVNDTTKTYNVCVNEYCATLDGSVFKGMTPLVAMDEAPVDNLSTIAALREHRDTEGLNIELDTTVHTLTLQNKIQQWKDALGSYDKASLTEAERTEIQNILDQVNYILASGDLATEEKTELQNVKAITEELLEDNRFQTRRRKTEHNTGSETNYTAKRGVQKQAIQQVECHG